jgi:hypothetical protein
MLHLNVHNPFNKRRHKQPFRVSSCSTGNTPKMQIIMYRYTNSRSITTFWSCVVYSRAMEHTRDSNLIFWNGYIWITPFPTKHKYICQHTYRYVPTNIPMSILWVHPCRSSTSNRFQSSYLLAPSRNRKNRIKIK